MEQPLVTAVMIAGLPHREKFTRAAVQSFRSQTYDNKELLILNDGTPIRLSDTNVREVNPEPGLTLGELRNIGLQHAHGEFVIQWDNDDFYHPKRIETQMNARFHGSCVLLRSQIRYSFLSNSAITFNWKYASVPGIPGSILHPNEPGLFYRSERRAEDDHFIQDNFQDRVLVVENQLNRLSHLYLRFYHGNNTWDERHVMGNATPGRWATDPDARDYLKQILKTQYQRDSTDHVNP